MGIFKTPYEKNKPHLSKKDGLMHAIIIKLHELDVHGKELELFITGMQTEGGYEIVDIKINSLMNLIGEREGFNALIMYK
jgi:hypothetical protein